MEPDKGYAWIVLISGFLSNFLLSTVLIIPSWYVIEYKNAFNINYAISGLPSAINSGFMLIMSVPAGLFVKYYKCKLTGVIGGICTFLGLFVCAFAPNLYIIIIAYGIVCSFGLSLSYSVALNSIQHYFKKYEASAANIIMSGFTVSFAVLMPCFNLLIEEYGWRGAHLIHSGCVLNLLVCSLLFRPFNTHEKEVTKDAPNKNCKTAACHELQNKGVNMEMNNEGSNEIDNIQIEEQDKPDLSKNFKSNFSKLDMSLFKSLKFDLFCLVSLLVSYIDEISTFTIAKLCDDLKINRQDTGFLKASTSIASLTFTVVNSFLVNIKWVNPILLNSLYHFGLGISLILFNFAWNYASSLFVCILNGMNYSGVYGLKYFVLSKIVTDKQQPMAIGWCQAVAVISCFVGMPLAGVMYDMTGSHNLSFYSAGVVGMMAGIMIIFIHILIRQDQRNSE